MPNSISIRAFISSYRADGPSVPKRHFDALRWCQNNIGLNATTDLERVRRCADAPGSHKPCQAIPLKMTMLTIISNAMWANNHFIAALACFWNLLVCSVVRPRHLQRSYIVLDDDVIIGYAKKGKKRTLGIQHPFQWACHSFDANNANLASALGRSMKHTKCGIPERQFMMPDFYPPRSDWATATAFTDTPNGVKQNSSSFWFVLQILWNITK